MDHTHLQTEVDVEVVIETTNPISQTFNDLEKGSSSSILTRLHAGYFRISMSLCGQALLWKTLGEQKSEGYHDIRRFLRFLPSIMFVLVWSIALLTVLSLSVLYSLRCLFHFKLVKAEFLHHIGVNYLFVPWISWILLLQSAPFIAPKNVDYLAFWWALVVPIVILDVKIYGQCFTKGKRFLYSVANPTSQLTVIGNMLGSRAAAQMGWKEIAVWLFSLGIVHYLVLFITLYQRQSGTERLSPMMRPVLFLFFAAPSMASLAWDSISGTFDIAAKLLFFLSLFIFVSLITRPLVFKRSMKKYTLAWWSYSFPLTVLAQASNKYSQEVNDNVAHGLMLILFVLSVLVSLGLLVFTAINSHLLLLPIDDSFNPSNTNTNTNTATTTSTIKSSLT